jgi:hypothetical protein
VKRFGTKRTVIKVRDCTQLKNTVYVARRLSETLRKSIQSKQFKNSGDTLEEKNLNMVKASERCRRLQYVELVFWIWDT